MNRIHGFRALDSVAWSTPSSALHWSRSRVESGSKTRHNLKLLSVELLKSIAFVHFLRMILELSVASKVHNSDVPTFLRPDRRVRRRRHRVDVGVVSAFVRKNKDAERWVTRKKVRRRRRPRTTSPTKIRRAGLRNTIRKFRKTIFCLPFTLTTYRAHISDWFCILHFWKPGLDPSKIFQCKILHYARIWIMKGF